MKKNNILVAVVLLLFLGAITFSSCVKEFDIDFDKLSDSVGINPTIAVPVVNASLKLEQFLPDNEEVNQYLVVDDAGFMTVKYKFDLTEFTAGDFFPKTIDFSGPSLPEMNYILSPQKLTLGIANPIEKGEVYIADPKIKLIITSGIVMPVQFEFKDFNYYKEENSDPLPLIFKGTLADNIIKLNTPTTVGKTAITEILIDNTTSNISDLISALPHHLAVGGIVSTIKGQPYSVEEDSKIKVALELEIPFDIRLKDFVMTDTIEFKAGEDISGQLMSAYMKIIFENGFPLDINVQIDMADKDYNVIGGLFTNALTIKSGTTTNGKVTKSTSSTNEIDLKDSEINDLEKTKYLIIKGTLNTEGASDDKSVKFYSTYSFGVKIGAKVQLSIKNN